MVEGTHQVRLRHRVASVVAAGPLLVSTFACGSASFPESPPCVKPSPTATPRGTSDRSNDALYRRHTMDGLARVEAANLTFRTTWPNDAPSNRQPFREAFVIYAAGMECMAGDLKALEPKGADYSEYNAAYDAAMDEVVEITGFGRDAVRSRNTSKYRDWIKKVEALPARFDEVEAKLPATTGGTGR